VLDHSDTGAPIVFMHVVVTTEILKVMTWP